MADQPSDIIVSVAHQGLNSDTTTGQLKAGQLTFAQNAVLENFDGNSVAYQNEQSNELCVTLPPGYEVIGARYIPHLSKTLLFLVNPQTSDSQIGEKSADSCHYHTIISAPCLNFHRDHPIHKIVVKQTNCATQVYWTDGYNPMRWIDLDDLPFQEIPDPDNEYKKIKLTGVVDCNKLLTQPLFSIPVITPVATVVGGDLQMGSYQFAIQYANTLGEGYTSFYSITNPIGIWEPKYGLDFNLRTTKAITLSITELDTTGLFDYFNLAVIRTVNAIPAVELVGTYPIGHGTYELIYTGQQKDGRRLTMEEIFSRAPYYDTAALVTSSDNSLLWAGLTTSQRINYQQIWSQVKVYWQTWEIPYTGFEGYSNAVNTALYLGYMGDEVYALEGSFFLKNGRITEKSHIPGRAPTTWDLEEISGDDSLEMKADPCQSPQTRKRWEVYNTATVTGYCPEYLENGNSDCYKGPYQYGEFAYWESTETYPANPFIWGDLAGRPIRHHRFPDSTLCAIHDNNPGADPNFQHSIFVKGIVVDAASLYKAIANSGLSQADKDQIAGFKIVRANRATHKSVVAKGLLFNIGQYEYEGSTYFYPNYPFNDLRPDPFLAARKIFPGTGFNAAGRLDGFSSADSRQRFTFHSPDTSFYQPFGVDSGYIKLETAEYGRSRSHFVEVKENARYKFLTKDATRLAFAAGMASVVTLQVGGGFGTQPFQATAGLQLDSVIPAFESTLTVLKNITPALNYGWQFNAVGNYCCSWPIPDQGGKIRSIELGGYLSAGLQHLGDTCSINNLRRESAVYLKVNKPLPYPHEVSVQVPEDNSRYIASEQPCDRAATQISERDISAYYGAIKRVAPDQYGRIYSYQTVDTGFYHSLYDKQGKPYPSFPAIFGGDTYVNRFSLKRKMPFFLDDTVAKAEGTDINLDDLSNVAYPMFWYSTKPVDIDADLSGLEDEIYTLTDTGFWTVLGNLLSGGTRPLRAGFTILIKLFRAYLEVLGVANINMDCASTQNMNELGKVYLYAYGIPYFFCESEVNTAYRQPSNPREGDYYPHVSSDIPDDWLQETWVPIASDNQYHYNSSYSKQNTETSFATLREDFDPKKLCTTHYDNRVIYSEKSSMEETKNNWLVYRPASYFDFPKDHGPLTAIDALEDRQLLVRFFNKSQLYNVLATVSTTAGSAYLGNPSFFSGPALDLADSELGYGGSQHQLFIKTPQGHLFADAIRGQIFLINGNRLQEISASGMRHFFKENLPFVISRYFPRINTDNHFAGIGLTGVLDSRYNRLLLTKKDYEPLDSRIEYADGRFLLDGFEVSLDDPALFCNKSWTLSYNLLSGSWVSFHSYVPLFYIGYPASFESGISGSIYRHGKALSFGNFYGRQHDYILEYPLSFLPQERLISSFADYTTVLKYTAPDVFYEVQDGIYFNQAVIYNDSQCSGYLNLVPRPASNLAAFMGYPRYNSASKDILVNRSDHLFSFNSFWDIVADAHQPFFERPCHRPSLDKIFTRNLDYSIRSHAKARIRSKQACVRLIYNTAGDYKLISRFLLTETQKSSK